MDGNQDDTKKYFNPKEYSTLMIRNTPILNRLISSPDRENREDVLKMIKKESGSLQMLVEAIEDKELGEYKADLLSACWESGIDCRSKLNYFVNVAISSDFTCCIEAYSVVCGMDLPVNQQELEKSITELKNAIQDSKDDKTELLKKLEEVLVSLKD